MANWVADYLASHSDAGQVVKRARHALHLLQANGETIAYCVGAPIHFLDTDNEWKVIDTTLKESGAEFGAPGLDVFIAPDGTVRTKSGYSHRTNRVGIFNRNSLTFTALATFRDGKIANDKLIRASGNFTNEIVITEDGAREQLVVGSAVSGIDGDWLVVASTLAREIMPDGDWDDFREGGYHFPAPRAWDAKGKRIPARRWARTLGGKQIIFTGVCIADLHGVVFPVTIDPDFSASTQTNYEVNGVNATYATARSTATTYGALDSYPSDNAAVGQNLYSGNYYIGRSFLKFDTSSVGSSTVITKANLIIYIGRDYSTTEFDISIVKQNWSSQDPIGDANRDTAYDNCLSGTQDVVLCNTSTSVGSKTSPDLDTTWISKTGTTYYSFRSSRDYANTAPSGNEFIAFAHAGNSVPANRPVLRLTYQGGIRKITRPQMGEPAINLIQRLGL